jgi:hypothetical protein
VADIIGEKGLAILVEDHHFDGRGTDVDTKG